MATVPALAGSPLLTPSWDASTSIRILWAKAAFLVLLTILIYIPSWSAQYTWDDDHWLLFCKPVHAGWQGLWQIWSQPSSTPHYYPLIFTGFWMEYK